MLTSKQRATLRGIASTYETIFQVGKGGISDTLVQQVSDALRKRELIKMHVLDNCPLDAGNRLVLFKRNPKEPVVKF